jgi:hypothetical protein
MTALLLKLLGQLSFGYFLQPQVKVFYKSAASSSGAAAGGTDGIECEWKGTIVFENLTTHLAQNLQVEGLSPLLELSHLPANSLKPYETREVKIVIRKSFPREIVTACSDRFKELLPAELKELHFLVSYQNLKEHKFYTKYSRKSGTDTSTYHFRKPTVF